MASYIGDTHGNFQNAKYEFKAGGKGISYIHVGDFGLNVPTRETALVRSILESLNKVLVRQKSFLYVNRGNHDNPHFWQNAHDFNLSNVRLMQDYEILNIEGKICLFLGGAISIDRRVLPPYKKWWPDEGFQYDEERLTRILAEWAQIDVVISHTAPDFAYPIGFNSLVHAYAKNDPSLLSDITLERSNLGKVYQILSTKFQIKRWIYGHFHFENTMHYNGTEFTIMPVNEYSTNQY